MGYIAHYKGNPILGPQGPAGPSEEVYSTKEARIGTWIDGKPVYRKTMSFPSVSLGGYSSSNSTASFPIETPLEAPIDVEGYFLSDDGQIGTVNGPWISAVLFRNPSGESMLSFKNIGYSSMTRRYDFTVNVTYTKTTDEGGAEA